MNGQSEKATKCSHIDYSSSIEIITPVVSNESSFGTLVDKNELSEEMQQIESSLVKRLDFIHIMPCLSILCVMQNFDKSALNYSAVLGIKEAAFVTDTEFAWLGSIFFIGYLLYQAPNAYLTQKLHKGRYLGCLVFVWGIILAVTALATNFFQLAVCRFLLGVFEAGAYTATMMIISACYRRSEQSKRIGFIYFMGGVSLTLGGVITYGIGYLEGVRGLEAWQWIMIILGSITVVFGVICFFCLKEDATIIAKNDTERYLVALITKDNAVVVTKKVNYKHIVEALSEPRYYCYAGYALFVNLQNGALLTFSSTITKGLGFSSLNAILLNIPTGIADCIFIIGSIYYTRKYANSILIVSSVLLFIAMIGHLLLWVIPVHEAKLVGLYLCFAYLASVTLIVTSIANNVSGYTKKVFYNSSFVFFATVGNFIGPQLMLESQKPMYAGGLVSYMIANIICIALLMLARYSMMKINRKRISNGENGKLKDEHQVTGPDPTDLTDLEDSEFIYRL